MPSIPSIMHFGPGAFARAHLGVLADTLGLEVAVVGMHHAEPITALRAAGGRYHVVTRSAGGSEVRQVSAFSRAFYAPEDRVAVADGLVTDVDLVTLTITQPGYHNRTGHGLDRDDPSVLACLESPHGITAIGMIAVALVRRLHAGRRPFAVMPLDNFVDNGRILRRVIYDYVHARFGPAEARWVARHAVFASTMVDRIVPARAREHEAWLAETWPALLDDKLLVFAEPMPRHCLVVGDHADHAALTQFARAGAVCVADVEPYSRLKIRLLNAAHLVLGMAGTLAGHRFAHEAMGDPEVRDLIVGLLEENAALIGKVPHVDVDAYRREVLARLEDPSLPDTLARLARNCCDKVPQRLLDPMREYAARGTPPPYLCAATALWARYLGSVERLSSTSLGGRGLSGLFTLEPMPSRAKNLRETMATEVA